MQRVNGLRFVAACALALTVLVPRSLAQEDQKYVPPSLAPWAPWVLEGAGPESCPLIHKVRVCTWPTKLSLDATDTGATFSLLITVDRKGFYELPGSSRNWPENVKVDGQPKAVLAGERAPIVELTAGTHTITGSFVWSHIPDALQLPADVGSVSLRVKGTAIAAPRREADGLIWLENGKGGDAEEERLELSVHRRLEDGVPMVLKTRVRVAAGGKAREVVLPNVLVSGARPVELHANLPARLTPEGSLRIQTQAGDYLIEIRAVIAEPLDVLQAPKAEVPWPEHETWVFQADDRLRHVELSGPPQIDPERTDLAKDWRGLPTYSLTPGASLRIETRRRGEPAPPPNQISLTRTLWLDLDGDGYTVQDELSGVMNRDFRLDLSQGTLGHARVDGKDQVITVHGEKSGVEVRSSNFSAHTEWRMEHGRSELSAVGYEQDVHHLRAQLNLPPGFKLMGIQGVDDRSGSWIEAWNLFDFFFVLLISLAVAKLAGRGFFVVAILALVLTHDEPDAPTLAWVFVLVFAALMRVVQEGRWGKIMRGAFMASVIGTLLVLVPFAVTQVREALYPQLEDLYTAGGMPWARGTYAPTAMPSPVRQALEAEEAQDGAEGESAPDEVLSSDRDALKGSAMREESMRKRVGSGSGSGYGKAAPRKYQQEVDPNQVVQTGPGVPTWTFNSYQLSWSGPVEHTQQIKLWILPPALTRVWSLLSVLLSAALLFAVLRAARSATPPRAQVGSAALALLLSGLSFSALPARAQEFPSKELLDELRTRLLEPAECEPNCLAVSTLKLKVEGARLTLRAQVNAGAPAAYQVPGPLANWSPDQIRVDGKEAPAAVRFTDGFLHVRVPAGLHEVEIGGPMPRSQSLTLALGSAPRRVEAEARGYEIEGLDDEGRPEGSLSLRRELAQGANEPDGEDVSTNQALEPWLLVQREFELGVRFHVRTTVTRLSATGASVLVRLPLLEGESVTESGLVSDKGTVVLELSPNTREMTFESTLAPRAELKLVAARPSDNGKGTIVRPWSETWIVRPSALYHATFEGIAPIARVSQGTFEPRYLPWPGERLTIKAEKLPAAEGASVTIDSAKLQLEPGARMEQSTLTFSVRTSHGASEHVSLPSDATLTACYVDGQARSARIKDGVLELHLDPGQHTVQLKLQRAQGIDAVYTAAPIKLRRPLTNVTTEVRVPEGRWLLWASGPSWGPAVLFWGYLIVVLLGALALSRVPFSPLKPHEWLLLGLGLTQVEVGVVFVVLAWLFCLAYRERNVPTSPLLFNFNQVFLATLTVVALICLAYAVQQGLVVQPDMQVQGHGSTNAHLSWYVDRTGGELPEVRVWSVPLWIYKGLMLLWALWLAASLLRWLRWGWSAFRNGGGWRSDALPKSSSARAHGDPARAEATPEPRAPSREPTQPLDLRVPPGQNPRVPLDQIERAQAELDRARKRDSENGEDA